MQDDARLNHGQSPLQGVVLCCTSIPPEQRSEMAAVAQQMGAVHKLDLTSDVTHLIVGQIDTQKYKYVAKERQDIKVLQPAWLDAVRESWIQGDETDVSALELQYKLPTLSKLQICVTGFDDVIQRTEIQDTVTSNGATYHGDLTKAVTHLIAATPVGKKYEYAGLWGIKIVTLDWLHDSLGRGMALEESLYHPLLPLEKRGKGAVTDKKMPLSRLGKHPRAEIQPTEPHGGQRRKLRRTASTRIESQNDDLWADIGSGEAQQHTDLPDKAQVGQAPVSIQHKGGHDNTDMDNKLETNPSEKHHDNRGGGIFSRDSHPVKVFTHGFDVRKTGLLRGYLTDNGALVLSETDMKDRIRQSKQNEYTSTDNVTIIIPHDSHIGGFDELFHQGLASRDDALVTEWWVETCLHRKHLVDHEREPLCLPFKTFPIFGFENLIVCPTSFSGIDLLLFSKAVKLMGAEYDESLRKETSVLVCSEAYGNLGKLRYALENKIPIVSADWFFDSVRNGRLESFGDYALSTTRQSQKSSQGSFYHPVHNPRPTEEQRVSFKSKKDRPGVRAPLYRGRLDLTRGPRTESLDRRFTDDKQSSSITSASNVDAEPREPRPLQSVSPSRQNTQQKDGPDTRLPLTARSGSDSGREETKSAATGGDAATRPNDDSLNSLESLQISRHETKQSFQDESQLLSEPSERHSAPPMPGGDLEKEQSANPNQNVQTLNTAIATLLEQRQRLTSLRSHRSSEFASASGLRHPRTLGRAMSNGSAGLSRTSSLDGRRRGDGTDGGESAEDTGLAADDERFDADDADGDGSIGARRSSRLASEVEARGGFRPSQALSYEDPEGAAVRERLMARLNGDGAGSEAEAGFGLDGFAEAKAGRGMRVESIGVVKDAVPNIDDNARRRTTRRK